MAEERSAAAGADVGLASVLSRWETRRERAAKGVIHIKDAEQQWELNRQGRCRFYAHLGRTDLANPDWICFRHEIHTHSGMHVHQGGLALFVTKGRGSTVVDGRRADWRADDVILLPIEPGGVEHQHFNEGDEPCEWIAFAFNPWLDAMGNGYEQRENHPDYRGDEPTVTSPPASLVTDRRNALSRDHETPEVAVRPDREPGAMTLYEALLARRDAERPGGPKRYSSSTARRSPGRTPRRAGSAGISTRTSPTGRCRPWASTSRSSRRRAGRAGTAGRAAR